MATEPERWINTRHILFKDFQLASVCMCVCISVCVCLIDLREALKTIMNVGITCLVFVPTSLYVCVCLCTNVCACADAGNKKLREMILFLICVWSVSLEGFCMCVCVCVCVICVFVS